MNRNKFGGVCHRCGKWCAPEEGFVVGKPGEWQITHEACIPVSDDAAYWRKSVLRRIRRLVEELERLEPDVLADILETAEAEELRVRLRKMEYDL